MLTGMTYYQIFSYFIIYSFIGWCVEVVYYAVRYGRVINRGFLNGPVCPVYGFGVLLVFAVTNLIALFFTPAGTAAGLPIPVLFVSGMILTTFVELAGGVFLDKCFHARWWDYTEEKFNLNGYICLKFSLIWGAGIVLIVKVLHPVLIENNLRSVPEGFGWWILAALYAAYVTDLIVAILTMLKLNRNLAELEEMRQSMRVVSNTLSMVLAEGTFVTENLVGKNENRVFEKASETDIQNTLETREEFDEKYDALQDSMNEKRDALITSVDEKRDALITSMDEKRDALITSMDEKRDALITSMDEKRADAEAVRSQIDKERDEWIRNFRAGSHRLMRHLFRSNPGMKHMKYQEAFDELRDILNNRESKAG